MKKFIPFLLLLGTIWCCLAMTENRVAVEVSVETPVWEVLERLGEPSPNHSITFLPPKASVEVGRNIVHFGSTKIKAVKQQSAHFVCTSCHNTEKEFADLRDTDPQKRLEYAAEHNLPFLPGSPLYGVVNRSSFYNGDYEKKYGKLVIPARNDLREAIQLCAVECSQGRALKDWEMESVLAYLWTLELKMEDLAIPVADYHKYTIKSVDAADLITEIKSYYNQDSPAHFVAPPDDREAGYGMQGDPANGEPIYKLSCLHCHEDQRYSFFDLNDGKLSRRLLAKHFPSYSYYSSYQFIRYGAPSHPGKRAYMPQFTSEKMSNQQVEDLRAYLTKK